MKTHTLASLYTHIILTRNPKTHLLTPKRRQILTQATQESISRIGCLILTSGGSPDHIHYHISHPPNQNLSQITDILAHPKHHWQPNPIIISISPQNNQNVHNYIKNQEVYHATTSTQQEREQIIKQIQTVTNSFNTHTSNQPFTSLHAHLIWTTKLRTPLLSQPIRQKLIPYLHTIAQQNNFHLQIANGIEDHIHCLIQYPPHKSISNIVQRLKGSSSH